MINEPVYVKLQQILRLINKTLQFHTAYHSGKAHKDDMRYKMLLLHLFLLIWVKEWNNTHRLSINDTLITYMANISQKLKI